MMRANTHTHTGWCILGGYRYRYKGKWCDSNEIHFDTKKLLVFVSSSQQLHHLKNV